MDIIAPIASDIWAYKLPDGSRRTSRVIVGKPRPAPGDPNGDWECVVYFEHVTPTSERFFGVGPVDCLMNAMRWVYDRFAEFGEVSPRASSN